MHIDCRLISGKYRGLSETRPGLTGESPIDLVWIRFQPSDLDRAAEKQRGRPAAVERPALLASAAGLAGGPPR